MKMQQFKSLIITHVVNPHHFYFKNVTECIGNQKFIELDYEIQKYGNDLYSRQSFPKGYTPMEDELVIFFHVVFNKWIRGKVIRIGEAVNLWCIDSGIFEKSTIELVLPLTPTMYTNLNMVHLGGLALLPAEKKFNIDSASIEMKATKQWDDELISVFNMILKNAKTVQFLEEMNVCEHKFGLLKIESIHGKTFIVNDKFTEMCKALRSEQFYEDISLHICKIRLHDELYKSVDKDAPSTTSSTIASQNDSTPIVSNNDYLALAGNNCTYSESEGKKSSIISNDFDDSASMAISSQTLQETNEISSPAVDHHLPEKVSDIGNQPTRNYENDFEYTCHLDMCSVTRDDRPRRLPLQSTMEWIKSMGLLSYREVEVKNDENAKDENESTVSSIINLNDDLNSAQSASSVSIKSSTTISNRQRMMKARLAAMKAMNGSAPGKKALNGVTEDNTKYSDLNGNCTTRLNAIPAGFQLSALNTFGGRSNWQ